MFRERHLDCVWGQTDFISQTGNVDNCFLHFFSLHSNGKKIYLHDHNWNFRNCTFMIEKLELELSKLDICIDFNALLHQTHKKYHDAEDIWNNKFSFTSEWLALLKKKEEEFHFEPNDISQIRIRSRIERKKCLSGNVYWFGMKKNSKQN